MTKALPPDTSEVFLHSLVPKGVQSVTLNVKIKPRTAAVLVYPSPGDPYAIRCNGPFHEITIGYGTGNIHVQKVDGAVSFEIDVIGYE